MMSQENVEVREGKVFLIENFWSHADAIKAVGLEE